MKLTESYLRKIVKEELKKVLLAEAFTEQQNQLLLKARNIKSNTVPVQDFANSLAKYLNTKDETEATKLINNIYDKFTVGKDKIFYDLYVEALRLSPFGNLANDAEPYRKEWTEDEYYGSRSPSAWSSNKGFMSKVRGF